MAKLVAVNVLLLLVSLVMPSLALESDEFNSLLVLNASFPALQYVNAMDEFGLDDVYYGGSWTNDLSKVCENGAGWGIHGVLCDADQHIIGLRCTSSWGQNTSQIDSLSLPYLKTFVVASVETAQVYNFEACAALMSALDPTVLEAVEILAWKDTLPYPTNWISQLISVRNLSVYLPSVDSEPDFSGLSSLEHLWTMGPVNASTLVSLDTFAPSNASLRSIETHWPLNPNGIVSFTALETATLYLPKDLLLLAPLRLPASLLDLKMVNCNASDLVIESEHLESLTLTGSNIGLLTLPTSLRRLSMSDTTVTWPSQLPASLESLAVAGTSLETHFPSTLFLVCDGLQSVELTYLNMTQTQFPSMEHTKLEKLVLNGMQGSSIVPSVVCASPATLKHLTLLISISTFNELPYCIGAFTMLESLEVVNYNTFLLGSNFLANVTSQKLRKLHMRSNLPDWEALTAQFPAMEDFLFFGTSTPSLFPVSLSRWSNLTSFTMKSSGLSGSLPSDLFTSHPKLAYLDLSHNGLNGTIPTAGWSKVKEINLDTNRFTHFPNLDEIGAPELTLLDVSTNHITSLPDDRSFNTMRSLLTLRMASNLKLVNASLPTLWATSTSKLRDFRASSCSFTGPLPAQLSNPHLRSLELSYNNLCGTLPEVTRSVALKDFALDLNRLQGTIPISWGQYLTVTSRFHISTNRLEGQIPNPVLAPYSAFGLDDIDISSNYFTGAVPNLSAYKSLATLKFSGLSHTLSACSRGTEPILPNRPIQCYPPSLSFGCDCPDIWQSCGSTWCSSLAPDFYAPDSANAIVTPIRPPYSECVAPSPVVSSPPPFEPLSPLSPPTAPTGCPLPSPGYDFTCKDGVWTSPASLTLPSLVVPGAIVVDGNLTVTQELTFNGLETQITIKGCFFLPDSGITIELTKEEIELLAKEGKFTKTLLTSLSDNGCIGATDLTTAKVSANKGPGSKGCRKLKVKNEGSTKSSLQVIFQVDSTNCKLMIILPSVFGAILIVTLVAIIVGVHIRNQKINPSKSRATANPEPR